jgi:hypothetical protein
MREMTTLGDAHSLASAPNNGTRRGLTRGCSTQAPSPATRPLPGRHCRSCQQEQKADRPQHRENDRASDIRRVPSPEPAIA